MTRSFPLAPPPSQPKSHSRPAHRLLAAMLWRQITPLPPVLGFIVPDFDFEDARDRVLWVAFTRLAQDNEPLNCSTLAEALGALGALAAVGGPRALTALSLEGQRVPDDLVDLLYDVRDAAVRLRLERFVADLHSEFQRRPQAMFDQQILGCLAHLNALLPLAARKLP